ncbi:calcium-binding protein [Paraburkholderia pallida]|uniref:Calcium-binding protein n=2 Tax=Paraburkholderia pallida TaxID=2547399 RepID=A0A4P7CWN0_9BURK|nr:calcium-binding protein [Paraburkholderia pallida]
MSAEAFLDSIAVNTHINYTDGAYADVRNVAKDLAWIGVRHVRDGTPGTSAPLSSYVWLAQQGVKFNFVVYGNVADSLQQLDRFTAAAPGSVAAVEGFNEINNFHVSYNGLTSDAAGLAAQQAIHAHVHGSASLPGVPVYDLTGYDLTPVSTRAGAADFTNQHIYPQNGEQPAYNANGDKWMAWAIDGLRKYNLPFVVTEFGYFTLPQSGWYGIGVDEATQAKGVLNGLFDAANLGVVRTYIYELLDEKPDPQRTNSEMHFGLFRNDHSPKPSASAIRNLTAILRANAAAKGPTNPHPGVQTVTPPDASSSCSLRAMPVSARSLLLTKGDGRYLLALWNETPFWDRAKGTPLSAPPASVQVDLGARASRIALYDPTMSADPLATHADLRQLSVAVPDHVVLLEVTPAGKP